MSSTSTQRRERQAQFNDKNLDESPYNKARRSQSYNRYETRNGSGGGDYTPTLITRAPRREKTFYKASNFRDSSPGNRDHSGATIRSNAGVSIRTNASVNSNGSGYSREGSVVRSILSVTNGIPDVPLLESPRITTSDGSFRLDYNERNKLSFRRISKPELPIQFIRLPSGPGKYPYYTHDDLVRIRQFTSPQNPPFQMLRNRERSFVNDAIVTTSQRTKYKDTLLTPYDSKGDRDIKRKYLNQESYYDSMY